MPTRNIVTFMSVVIFATSLLSKTESTVLPPVMTLHPAPEVAIVTDSSFPEFEVQLPYYRRTEFINQSFTLDCEATGQPRYRWTKNDIPFNHTGEHDQIKQFPGQGTLIFMAPRDADVGLYQCFAENDLGTAVSNPGLVRKVWIDSVQNITENATAMQGLPFRLKCHRLRGWPKPQFNWLRNGKPVEDHRFTVDPEGDLWIAFMEFDEESKLYEEINPENTILDIFTCVVKTTYMSFPVKSVTLSVEQNPEFLHRYAWRRVHLSYGVQQAVSGNHESAVTGQSKTLYCIYGGMPVPEILWYRNNQLLLEEPQHIKMNSYGKILQISKVRPEDRGNYTCRIIDGSENEEQPHKNILLSVNAIPNFEVEPQNMNVTLGERAKLQCRASGKPAPSVTWYHNGRKLSSYRKSSHPRWSVTDHALTIEDLNFTDTGNYGCNVTNAVGYVYRDVYINVVKPPTSPLLPILIASALIISAACVVIYVCIRRKQQKRIYKLPLENEPVEPSLTLSPRGSWHFNRSRLKLLEIIGEGNFGRVYLADAIFDGTNSAHVELLHEIEIMKRIGSHLHIVKIIGACAEMKPSFLILELLRESLHQYLRRAWRDKYYRLPTEDSNCVTSKLLASFAFQIARGMKHVSSQGVVHRDLATRNIMLSSDLVCKIADFGLARELDDDDLYVRKTNIPLPIRWMSPESLLTGKTSVKCDIWSFGVLLWELVSLGATPYPGKKMDEVKHMVCKGNYMEMPKTCKPELYDVMLQCWHLDPLCRPDFETCIDLLETLLQKNTDYIKLQDFPDDEYFIVNNSDRERV